MDAPMHLRVRFLASICTFGTLRMLRPFLDAGADINEGKGPHNYLAAAAYSKNFEIFQILLDSGAVVGPALLRLLFLNFRYSDEEFRFYITMTADHAIQVEFDESKDDDSILSFLYYWRCSDVITPILEHFLCAGLFINGRLFGGESIFLKESYIFVAIIRERDQALSLLLKHGIDSRTQIGHQFNCPAWYSETRSCTWLTLAVRFGRAPCVKILLKYVDVHVCDGSGYNALELAKYYTTEKHPRLEHNHRLGVIFAEDDDRVLAVLEEAIASQAEGCPDGVIATRKVIPTPDAGTELFTFRSWKCKSMAL